MNRPINPDLMVPRLVDGALASLPTLRQAMIERMAADLVRYDAAQNEHDAVRSLYGTGRYAMVDIVMLVEEARQVAFQEIVATEMAKP